MQLTKLNFISLGTDLYFWSMQLFLVYCHYFSDRTPSSLLALSFIANMISMIYYGNKKSLINLYLLISALVLLITLMLEKNLIPVDEDIFKFLFLISYAEIFSIGPFRFLNGSGYEKKAVSFLFFVPCAIFPIILQTKYLNLGLPIFYASLSSLMMLFLYIFRYKQINSLILIDVYTCIMLLESNFGYFLYDKQLYYILFFCLLITHLIISFKNLDREKYYIDLIFSFTPLIFGINIVSIAFTAYLLLLVSIKKYINIIIEFTYGSFTDLFPEAFTIVLPNYKLNLPRSNEIFYKLFQIKLNLSFTIALIFIIISFLITAHYVSKFF